MRGLQGNTHAFLSVKSPDGRVLASGEIIQTANADRVNAHVVIRFRDGSLDEETTVYSQHGNFRLISDHHIQHGPSYPHPLDMLVEASGDITYVKFGKDGQQETKHSHLDLPPDVANGLLFTLVLNIASDTPETTVPIVALAPEPKLVNASIRRGLDSSYSVGGSRHTAGFFVVKTQLGGIQGIVAPLVGKQPADAHIWTVPGEAPSLIRVDAQLYDAGPIWRIELLSPIVSTRPAARKSK